MIALLLPLLARVGVTQRFAKPLAWATTLIVGGALLWAAFSAWDYFDDKAAVNADRAAANLETAKAVTKADRTANAKADERKATFETQQKELEHEAAKGDDGLAGPGVRGVFGRMRAEANNGDKTAR